MNKSAAGSTERQQNITKLADPISAQHNADAALAGTQTALTRLIAAHRALISVRTTPATFKTVVASLWAQAKAAQDFYSALPSK